MSTKYNIPNNKSIYRTHGYLTQTLTGTSTTVCVENPIAATEIIYVRPLSYRDYASSSLTVNIAVQVLNASLGTWVGGFSVAGPFNDLSNNTATGFGLTTDVMLLPGMRLVYSYTCNNQFEITTVYYTEKST